MAEAQNDDPVEQFRVGFARILEEGEPPWELIADDFVWDMSGVPWAEHLRSPPGLISALTRSDLSHRHPA